MTNKKSFCFIPAKALSTRLKKKNLLKLNGKELIHYPINNAIQSKIFDPNDIILSSESEEIKAVAERLGANVPYLRDAKLSLDPYGVVHVLLDFLENFPRYKEYDSCCILLPTSPFMIPADIENAFDIFHKKNFDVVMSVSPTEHNGLRSVYIRDENVVPVLPQFIHKQSTELEPTYRINGAVIVIKTAKFVEAQSYFLDSWGAYKMPSERSVDIDTEEDYKYAQYLVEKNGIG